LWPGSADQRLAAGNQLYSRLNQGDYLSSDPGIAVGAVNLTIYEKR
jgi:hypothetical protein